MTEMDHELQALYEWLKAQHQAGDKDATAALRMLHKFVTAEEATDDTDNPSSPSSS
jgi:hypothetical protein